MVAIGTVLAGIAGFLVALVAGVVLYQLVIVGVPAAGQPMWAVPVTGLTALAMLSVGIIVVVRVASGDNVTANLLALGVLATVITSVGSSYADL